MSAFFRSTIALIAPQSRRDERLRAFTGLGAGLCLLFCAPALFAQPSTGPRVAFNGFGTVGLASSSEREADFIANQTQARGPGHTDPLSLTLDSRIAGQLFARVSNRLTAVVQVVAEQDAHHTIAPTLEWANLSYAATPNFSLRAGRIVAPVFLVSEYRKVSFATAWVRPPVELYTLIPLSAWDGADATYHHPFANWNTSLNVLFGRTSVDVPSGRLAAQRTWGANGSVQRGAFTGRAATFQGTLGSNTLDPLMQGFQSLGPAGVAVADRFAMDGRHFTFSSTGVEYNRQRWFTMAEFARFSAPGTTGTKGAGYLHAGLRWRALTPFATYSLAAVVTPDSVAGVDLTALTAELVPLGTTLNKGLNAALQSAASQQNVAIGLRWDVRAGLAMKMQLDAIDVRNRSTGTFTNFQPRFEPGHRVYLVSASTAFVF